MIVKQTILDYIRYCRINNFFCKDEDSIQKYVFALGDKENKNGTHYIVYNQRVYRIKNSIYKKLNSLENRIDQLNYLNWITKTNAALTVESDNYDNGAM